VGYIGHSRSLKIESLGTPSILVTMAVSVAVCNIFSVKEWPDLENRVRVYSSLQGHWKWHHLIDRIRVYILSCLHTRSGHKYYTVSVTFKARLRVTQGH